MFQQVGIGLVGGFFGLMVSGGVFTALLALGLVPRFAGKTHTANKILTYESVVVSGCIAGGFLSVFPFEQIIMCFRPLFEFRSILLQTDIYKILLIFVGFYGGCFVGCLAFAIAEILDSIPIFARRIGFSSGKKVIIIVMAIGKTLGSLIYFALKIYNVSG